MKKKNKSQEESPEFEKLRAQLEVAEETLRAIRSGEVDALVVSTPQCDQVFTLKGAERPYRILMEKMKEGAVTLAGDDTIFYCNQGFADMLKWPLEKIIGTGISQFVSPVDQPVFEELLRQGRECGSKGEATFLAWDGTAVPIQLSLNTMPMDGISIVYLVATDITERKMAEEALQKAHDELEIKVLALMESEASYRELTESIDDLFYAMDRELRYTYWNSASEALTGVLAKDAIGKSLYELFPEVKGTKAERLYIETSKMQQPQRFESQFRIGGKKFIFEINAYPTKTGSSIIAKDITEKKKLESQLLRAQRMESIGTLAGGIAHDLNNMLTPMMLSLQMLKGKFKDEQSQKLLAILEKSSQRGADLIKQVLLFARGVEGERAPLQAKHIITEIEKIVKETFPRNIEIRTDIQKDLSTISGDDTQLHQVLMNLCVNARDAMPDGGTLNISAENSFIDENYTLMHPEVKVGSYIAIAVSDTGIGISPKIVDRIFEPFFTTKEFGKGTGLGLSMAHAIVRSHGGFINVYSEVGAGTIFRVYLPAIKTEMQNAEEQQHELLVGHGELVLVAEDEDSVREINVSALETYGYKVITANDGADAAALYAQNKDNIKVILMDMMMPVMDGHASIRAIRKINPEVKIIAISGLPEKDKVKKATDHTNAFLPKPYTAEKLLKTIREVIGTE